MTMQTHTPNYPEDKCMDGVTLKNGYWFYFEDGNDQIAVFGSGWSGKEIVYFNDDPISETRNTKFESVHTFTKNGKHYQIVYRVISMMTGEVQCRLYINDQLHDEQSKAVVKGDPKEMWKTLGKFFIIGMVFGFIGAQIATRLF